MTRRWRRNERETTSPVTVGRAMSTCAAAPGRLATMRWASRGPVEARGPLIIDIPPITPVDVTKRRQAKCALRHAADAVVWFATSMLALRAPQRCEQILEHESLPFQRRKAKRIRGRTPLFFADERVQIGVTTRDRLRADSTHARTSVVFFPSPFGGEFCSRSAAALPRRLRTSTVNDPGAERFTLALRAACAAPMACIIIVSSPSVAPDQMATYDRR